MAAFEPPLPALAACTSFTNRLANNYMFLIAPSRPSVSIESCGRSTSPKCSRGSPCGIRARG
jgi:hypothetical protein